MTLNVAFVAFDGFNEIDSFVGLHLFGRLRRSGVEVTLTGPTPALSSVNGVTVTNVQPLESTADADVVLIGSGIATPSVSTDLGQIGRLRLDPSRQLVGSQCSGALILHALGLADGAPICTDARTRPMLVERSANAIEAPLYVKGNVASAGGCLASIYLSAWAITRILGWSHAEHALRQVAPVGEEADWIARTKRTVSRFEPIGASGQPDAVKPDR